MTDQSDASEVSQLRAELELLRCATDLARVSPWSFDLVTRTITWSDSCGELFGLAPGVMATAEYVCSCCPLDDQQQMLAAVAAGLPFELHPVIVRHDGTVRHVSSRAVPVRDPHGVVVRYQGVMVDHSERQAMEQRLRKLSMVAERTWNGVVVANRDGLIEWVNAGFTRLTGYTLDEVMGRRPGKFLQGPGTDPATVALMRERLARFEPFHAEVLNYTKAGQSYWVDIDVQPMRDEAGVVTHLMAIETDITERKAAEAAQAAVRVKLEQSLSMLQVVLDGTEHSVIATDAKGNITFFNRGAERMLGWTASEMVGVRSPAVLHDPMEVVAHARHFTQVLGTAIEPGFDVFVELARRGRSETREWTYVRKDGSRLVVALTVTALRGPGGEVHGFLGVASDVTAQRQVEVARREYIERLVKLSRHLPGVVYQFQRFPDGRSCFPWASEGLREIYGVDPEDVRLDATKAFARLHPDDLEDVTASITRSATTLGRWEHEYRVRQDAGRVRWLLGTATPEPQPDGSVLWHGYISDNTERKAFEAELVRAREAALDASRVKSEFLANMSHEIRTPLNGILGMTQLLLEATPSPEQHGLLDAVRESGQTMMSLINDILDLSKVESGRMELEAVPFAPRELLQRVVQTVSVRAEEKGLLVRLEVEAAVPAFLLGDPTRVFQVLLNLAGNAAKFTAAGEVRLVARVTAVGALRVEVHDSGIGIPADQLPKLFQAFTQGDGSITRRYGGTGLGLAISRKLTERMGGRLQVTSQAGVGSCFSIELPLPVAQATEPPAVLASAGRAGPGRSLCVLVAEDNAINALVVRTLLEREGHSVVHVTTGTGAVEATAQQRFDLVLMDMQMPELDGLEATRRIRIREGAGGRVAICALTANAMKGDIERCREAGMDDYLAKPLELAALRQKLSVLAQPALRLVG